MFKLCYDYTTNIETFVKNVSHETYSKAWKKKRKGGYHVYNIPCSFDIETSSFYEDGEKRVIMYIWQFCFNGRVIIGRTWKQFIKLCEALKEALNLSENLRLYVYVHNLSYEFQFMRKWFSWLNVFSVDTRKPVKALTNLYIEFKDSYILSGYKLETVANHLQKYHVKKLVGDLNYTQIRTPLTHLTEKEMAYCINDVLIVVAYIKEYIEQVKYITRIPLTQTGQVRKYCKEKCYKGFDNNKEVKQQTYYDYRALMDTLQINNLSEYKLLKRAFQGGFTHANAKYVNNIMHDVSSYDFTSSYPAVMLMEQYPMGKGFKIENVSREKFNKYAKNNLMIFDLLLENVKPKIFSDNPISISRCYSAENYIINNGRVAFADRLVLSATNIDLQIYLSFYDIEHVSITNCYCYAMGYLPRNFILSILSVYNDKTKLKGVKGKEKEYLHSKELLNSMYGMSVTDIVQDLITYDNDLEWGIELQDKEQLIEKYNKNKSRFLFYPWGIFVTAYARRNLFSGILECKDDYIYSDTDSIKILNREKHLKYFSDYNKSVETKLRKMCNFYNIPFKLCKPKTIKGKEKLIGVWDYEGDYKYFKTLGAKRYLYYDTELHATIAGTSKKGAADYLSKDGIKEAFNKFNSGLIIPADYTGKLTHTYIDSEMKGIIKDYQNNYYNYCEKSGVHMEKTEYHMSLSQAFIDFLRGVKNEAII